jgi:hypothetical protein
MLKLFRRITAHKITTQIGTSQVEQGFRPNRFILRQRTEKSIQFNKPLYLCFVGFTQAFDRIQLNDVLRTQHKNNTEYE